MRAGQCIYVCRHQHTFLLTAHFLWSLILKLWDNSTNQSCKKEGNVLFNDALNTFLFTVIWRRTYMVKDHSDSERENPLPPHGLLFPISSKGSFICTTTENRTYHGICYTSRGTLAGTRNSSMCPPWRIDPMTHRTTSERFHNEATSQSSSTNHILTWIIINKI